MIGNRHRFAGVEQNPVLIGRELHHAAAVQSKTGIWSRQGGRRHAVDPDNVGAIDVEGDAVGADGYAADASTAVRLAKQLIEQNRRETAVV